MTFTPAVLAEIRQRIPENRVFNDPVSTLAFGTDASFYRLIPKVVVRVQNEGEVVD
ncbi:MAG: FAD-binding oxidoreductase, partial [Marinobacter sp.]|nr:FAD-binding oxidoreductase [Marinobacter sp.]